MSDDLIPTEVAAATTHEPEGAWHNTCCVCGAFSISDTALDVAPHKEPCASEIAQGRFFGTIHSKWVPA